MPRTARRVPRGWRRGSDAVRRRSRALMGSGVISSGQRGNDSRPPMTLRRLTTIDGDRSVPAPHTQRAAAVPEPPAYGPAVVVSRVRGEPAEAVRAYASVVRVRIELRVDVRRQIHCDRSVAGRDAPVVLHHAAVVGAHAPRSVTAAHIEQLEPANDADRTVARFGLHSARRVVDVDRSVTGVRLQSTLDPSNANAAIAGVDVDRPCEVVCVDRSIAGARVERQTPWCSDDQADRMRPQRSEVYHVALRRRTRHIDDDLVAVLRSVDDVRFRGLLVGTPAFDLHQNLFAVPRFQPNRTVKCLQLELRIASDGEPLLLADDGCVAANVDGARGGSQGNEHDERASHVTAHTRPSETGRLVL